jgi:hypothetical protein
MRFGVEVTKTTAHVYVLVKRMIACFNKRAGYHRPVELPDVGCAPTRW